MTNEDGKRSGIRRILDMELSDLGRIADPARFGTVFRILLCLWALLPALALLGYLWSWVHNGGMRSQAEAGNLHVYYGALYYSRMYFALETVTLLAVMAHLLVFQRSAEHLRRAARAEPWNVLLLLLLLWAVPGTLLSADPWIQATGSTFQFDGLVSYVLWAGIYLCALLCPPWDRLLILRIFTGTANVCVLSMLGQAYAWPVLYDALFHTESAVFVNLDHFAYYLCTSAALTAGLFTYDRGKKRTVWYAATFLFQTYGLLYNDAFGSYVALIFALPMILLFLRRSGRGPARRDFFPLAALLAISVLFYLGAGPFHTAGHSGTFAGDLADLGSDLAGIAQGRTFEGQQGGNGRLELWGLTLENVSRHPILGFGPNGTPSDWPAVQSRPHNAFLQIALFHGVPGLVLYAAALIGLLVRQWGRLRDLDPPILIAAGGVACYLASSFFGVPMFYTTSYLFLLLGFAAGRPSGDPLLDPDPPAERTADTGRAVHWERMAVLLTAVLIAAAVVWSLLETRVEQEREWADVSYMRLANYQGQVHALSSGVLSDGTRSDGMLSGGVPSGGVPSDDAPASGGTASGGAAASDGTASWPLVFWLEPEEGVLVEDPVPAYGAGTPRRGRQAFPDEDLEGLGGMSYDTAEDHRGQALRVTIGPGVGSDGYLVEWVPAD